MQVFLSGPVGVLFQTKTVPLVSTTCYQPPNFLFHAALAIFSVRSPYGLASVLQTPCQPQNASYSVDVTFDGHNFFLNYFVYTEACKFHDLIFRIHFEASIGAFLPLPPSSCKALEAGGCPIDGHRELTMQLWISKEGFRFVACRYIGPFHGCGNSSDTLEK